MAKKKSSTRTWSSTRFLDCLGYFAMIFIAIALIMRLAFRHHNGTIERAFQVVGECLAYVSCMCLGFYWTTRKRNIAWLICWIIAAVTITIVYIFAVI